MAIGKGPVPKTSAQAFIDAAPGKTDRPRYPWEEPGVRENAIDQMQLRLKEPLSLKIKYILTRLPTPTPSRHAVIIEAIEEWVERKLAKLED